MIRVNGEQRPLPDRPLVRELVEELGLGSSPCAVEVNGELVPRSRHETHPLAEGDRVEIVTLVGGG